jgi:uncharacterized protein (DUF885 family)
VRPAFERLLTLLNELHARTSADAGLWRLPQGDAAYHEAQRTMGQRFSLRDFHDVVLKTGSVPLDVLSDVVRSWARASN